MRNFGLHKRRNCWSATRCLTQSRIVAQLRFLSVGQVQRVADLMYGTGMISTAISVKDLLVR